MKALRDQERHELQRSKEMTPGARLDWLAAAREFMLGVERAKKKQKKS